MKLHYKGKYNLDPQFLPCGEHKPGAVKFKEAESSAKLSVIANGIALGILIVLGALAAVRISFYRSYDIVDVLYVIILATVITIPFYFVHEILHAVCFKKDVYLYTNWKQGMLFVIGPEDMSKVRFIFLSLLPNIILGIIPYILGMIFPNLILFTAFGIIMTASGAGDYYNVFNALTQMPKGSRTYLHGFNSYWYIPR